MAPETRDRIGLPAMSVPSTGPGPRRIASFVEAAIATLHRNDDGEREVERPRVLFGMPGI